MEIKWTIKVRRKHLLIRKQILLLHSTTQSSTRKRERTSPNVMVPIQILETTRSESPSRAYSIPFFKPGTATFLIEAALDVARAAAVERPRTPEALKTKRNETISRAIECERLSQKNRKQAGCRSVQYLQHGENDCTRDECHGERVFWFTFTRNKRNVFKICVGISNYLPSTLFQQDPNEHAE